MRFAAPLAAAAASVLFGSALFVFLGLEPLAVHAHLLPLAVSGSLLRRRAEPESAAPLALCAVGLAIGFRANVWNIGAEGQLVLGAMAGGGFALAFPNAQGAWLLPAMFVAGALGGMAWAALPAFLKVRFNTNEILTT